MRILVVSHSAIVPANQKVFANLEARQHGVCLVRPRNWPLDVTSHVPDESVDLLPTTALRVLGAGSIPLHVYDPRRVHQVLQAQRPDVLFVEEEPYSLACFQWAVSARLLKIPYVVYSLQNILKRYPLLFRQTEGFVARHAATVVALTEDVAQVLVQRGHAQPRHIIPLAVDTDAFVPRREMAPRPPELGASSDAPVVMYAGRLVDSKGISDLLAAYTKIRQELPSARLVCLGSGPWGSRAASIPGVTVLQNLGHAKIPDYLKFADLLVLPSRTTPAWKEQLGRAALEAMACEVPVVGSDSGAIPEVIRRTGGGLLFPEGDSAVLADTCLRLLNDRPARLQVGSAGRRGVIRNYSISTVSTALEACMHEALEGVR